MMSSHPSPSSTQPQGASGAKPKAKPTLPKDEKEAPNMYTKILHLEGTKQNNLKAKALASFSKGLAQGHDRGKTIYFHIIISS